MPKGNIAYNDFVLVFLLKITRILFGKLLYM